MRLSTAQFQRQSIQLMQQQSVDIAKTQAQLASGKRLQTPSDDPLAAAQLQPLKDNKAVQEQYERNADVAEYRLQLEDIQLAQFGNVLTRINELAVQGVNGSMNDSDRATVAQEIRQGLTNLVSLANTQDANGDYLFAGDNVKNTPIVESPANTFTYTGDAGIRDIQIGKTRQIASGDPGSTVFMNVPFSGGGTQDIFTSIANFATSLEANTPSNVFLDDVQAGLDNVLITRTKIGARLNAIDVKREDNDARIFQTEVAISRLEDVDFAEAISRLSLQLVSLQASQQAFGRIQSLSLFDQI
ncbi:MAG: flagellar hook-associated protein FlgL [Thiohalomonadales bacterium]